jgi:hypothetical protein
VHSALINSSNSSVGALLGEGGVVDVTTGVLTSCDRVRSDDPDVPDIHNVAALLPEKLGEHSRSLGGGKLFLFGVYDPRPIRALTISVWAAAHASHFGLAFFFL